VTFTVIMIVKGVQNDTNVYMLYNITKINNISLRYCKIFSDYSVFSLGGVIMSQTGTLTL
jgi:Mg2+/Co2+ transporter CorC